MALDKQRILNELGSVMNQLKSADCGCMGKLFGGSGQAVSPSYGGCRYNCCHGHGCGWNSTGSISSPQGNAQNMNSLYRHNPRNLYADTYNYLNGNLMQPTIKEVYNDLKSLTPDNTIVNNPIANQIGLSPNAFTAQANTNATNLHSMNSNNMATPYMGSMNATSVDNVNAGNMSNNFSYQPANDAQMGQIGGMGPQIMSMIGGNIASQNINNSPNLNMTQTDQLTKSLMYDASQSPHSIGMTPVGTNQNVYSANSQNHFSPSYNHQNQSVMQNVQQGQNASYTGNTNSTAHQMPLGQLPAHHSKGIAKFNEMFPGVTKDIGEDLGFDPMSIAIQMNPANRQQAAISTMNQMMQNNNLNKMFEQAANPAVVTGNSPQQDQIRSNVPPNEISQSTPLQQRDGTVQPMQSNEIPNNHTTYQNAINTDLNTNANIYGNQNAQLNNQRVYTANNHQNSQPEQQYEQQNIIDPNTGVASLNRYPKSPNVQQIKEPIFPTDTSRMRSLSPKRELYDQYNTLGQPIQKFTANLYRKPEPNLPQTLSPQPTMKPRTNAAQYSNVKSTVSKTSLMGSKIGRTPSQLQHIYNQYKGSQSFTQQNIGAPVNNTSHSEGKLNASLAQLQRQVPVEKVAGDTVANNQMLDKRTVHVGQVIGQIGDVPAATVNPIVGDKPNEMALVTNRKTRNGLQDMVYTSYPSSAAWSFHGERTGSPCNYGRKRYGR